MKILYITKFKPTLVIGAKLICATVSTPLCLIIISLFALENNAHCLKRLQLVSTDYFNS